MFVEGKRTEDGYFKHWARQHRGEVVVNIHERNGGPLQLVEWAVASKKREAYEARRKRGDAHDEIWCVFDRDRHPKVSEAIALAQQHGIRVAMSNPCIELWFILHYEDQTAHIESAKAQRRSHELTGCEKALTVSALKHLEAHYASAAKRAKALDKKHAGDDNPPRHNPSSEVWRLVDRIRLPPGNA